MIRPRSIRVGGLDLPVAFVVGLESFGEFDADSRVIRIRAGLDPPVAASTMLHELLHAIDDAHGARISEHATRAIECGLVAALRHDPAGARRWLDALLWSGTGFVNASPYVSTT
jgi:hypothetical protein